MKERLLQQSVKKAYLEGRRLIAPLAGFPGLNIAGSTVKLAQQNYSEHFKVIKAIADTFQPDLVFPLMDLSVEAHALGRYTVFPKTESATVVRDKFTSDDLAAIKRIDISADTRLLGYVETLKLMKAGLPDSIIKGAYVTGPYTLASLLVGADEAAISTVMRPDEFHKICDVTTEKIMVYVQHLAAAGAQLVCILEPSAVMLGPEEFEQFSVKYVRRILEGCEENISTVYHICGNTMHLVKKMAESGIDGISLDAPETGVDLKAAAEMISDDVAIIGNISPIGKLLNGEAGEVEKEVIQLLEEMESHPNFVLSTGCDLPQETPIENIQAFMKTGREYKISKEENIL